MKHTLLLISIIMLASCNSVTTDKSENTSNQKTDSILDSIKQAAIEKKYSQFKNTVLGNEALYPDYNRNFNYNY